MKLILKLVLLYRRGRGFVKGGGGGSCRGRAGRRPGGVAADTGGARVFRRSRNGLRPGARGQQKAPGRAGGCTVGGGDAKKRGQNRMGKTSERASPPRKESRLAERA